MWASILFWVFSLIICSVVVFFFRAFSLDQIIRLFKNWKDGQSIFVSLFQVEKESRKHGGLLVASVLKEEGVKELFTLCGGHISPILVGCEARGIRVVDVRHEASAVFAADAVARLRQGVGVAAVTAGPGLTNTVTAVKNAQMAESPVVLLGGAAATLLKGRGALQDIDQLVLFRPLCKFSATVRRVRDIVPILRKAIQAARSGTPGPVFVEFPIDSLYPYHVVHRELGLNPSPRSIGQRLVNYYLQFHVSRLFGGAWQPQDVSPLPSDIPLPMSRQVSEAATLVSSAQRPLILIGSQALLAPVSPEQLADCIQDLRIPCFLGGMARGLLGQNSPLQIRHQRRQALKQADLVVLAGAVCDFRLSYGRVLNKKSSIIAVNRNKKQMLKNSDMFWKPSLVAHCDVASFLVALKDELDKKGYQGADAAWLETLRAADTAREAEIASMAETASERHLNPLRALAELERVLPADTILVADGGDFVGSAAYTLRPRGPLQWLDPGAFGTLGVGGGFALGAKLCRPDSVVVIIYGDGSCGYSIAELDSLVRHKTPVLAVVGNDACWSQIVREQLPMFGSSVGCDLDFTNYDQVAVGFGAIGKKVDGGDLGAQFRECLEQGRTQSVLVNLLLAKSNFREGSISV